MQSHGLIDEEIELRADRVSRGDKNVCELVIDDFMPSQSFQTPTMQWLAPVGLEVYKAKGLLGSAEKDVHDACQAKVTGAQLDFVTCSRHCHFLAETDFAGIPLFATCQVAMDFG